MTIKVKDKGTNSDTHQGEQVPAAQPVCFVSRWQLRNGMDAALLDTLQTLAALVESREPGTLMYRINLPAATGLDNHFKPMDPPPPPIPLSQQTEVIFLEMYASPEAFAEHVKGDTFQHFLKSTTSYFKPNPDQPGWPVSENTSMALVTGFARASASTIES